MRSARLNYRHAFHAGNFADVHKHAVLLQVLGALTAGSGPLTVIDTHAGAGLYDLGGETALKSGEAKAGIDRLLADDHAPTAFALLIGAVKALNREGGERPLYPGSPLLIAGALRPGDRYIGCELREEEAVALRAVLAQHDRPGGSALEALQTDGFAAAARLAERRPGRVLLLIDPPYERGDDAARIVATLAATARSRALPAALIWAPIKDLESYDALLRGLETLPYTEGWASEARLRLLGDPMRLNGSVMVGLGLAPPPGLHALTAWVAASAGHAGASGRFTPLFC